jgi:hypothetical protein
MKRTELFVLDNDIFSNLHVPFIPVHSHPPGIQMATCISPWWEGIPCEQGISPWGNTAQVFRSLTTKLALNPSKA